MRAREAEKTPCLQQGLVLLQSPLRQDEGSMWLDKACKCAFIYQPTKAWRILCYAPSMLRLHGSIFEASTLGFLV